MFRRGHHIAAQHVELDLDAEQRLQDAVVQVAGDAAAFSFDGAGAKMAQQKDIFKRGTHVAGDASQPFKIGLLKLLSLVAQVDQENAARGLSTLIERNADQIAQSHFLLRSSRQAGQRFQLAVGIAIPAKARAFSHQAVPADRRVHIIQQKSVTSR